MRHCGTAWTTPALAMGWAAALLFGGTPATLGQVRPTYANVPYGDGHERQVLDVYLPPGPGPFPVVVWIHGGGWQSGDKGGAAGKFTLLSTAGIAVVGINYRYSSQAIFPAQIHDCKAAIRAVRRHANEWKLDPSRLGVWGSSAGGHLTALVATSGGVAGLEGEVGGDERYGSVVQAAADYFGPTDLFAMGGGHDQASSPESKLVGCPIGETRANMSNPAYAECVARIEAASPLSYVTNDDPVMYIAHGLADGTVPYTQSVMLSELLTDAGVPNTLNLVPGAGHGMPSSVDQLVRQFFVAELAALSSCPADLTGDRTVDDADFTIFAEAYEAFTDTRGDLNRDGITDDSDFVIFAASYEAFACG